MKHILITGVSGFIGKNLMKFLRSVGLQVYGVDKLCSALVEEPITLIQHELGQPYESNLLSSMVPSRVQAVVHLAALTNVDHSILDPLTYYDNNVKATNEICDFCAERGLPLIHVSTDEVFGSVNSPANPTDQLKPANPYAASKAAAEAVIHSYRNMEGLRAAIVRPTNMYGPYQDDTKVTPRILKSMLESEYSLPMYGDGMNVREWLNTYDFCRFIQILLAEDVRNWKPHYHVGGGENARLSLAKYIMFFDVVAKELGANSPKVRRVVDRKGHDKVYALAPTFCHGWQARVTFKEGISQIVRMAMHQKGTQSGTCSE